MLLSESELTSLPGLYSQENEEDPVIHAKLSASDQEWACYIAEAGRRGTEYEIFGLFVGKYGHNWAQLPLTIIEQDLRETGVHAALDRSFRPDRSSSLTGLKRRGSLSVS